MLAGDGVCWGWKYGCEKSCRIEECGKEGFVAPLRSTGSPVWELRHRRELHSALKLLLVRPRQSYQRAPTYKYTLTKTSPTMLLHMRIVLSTCTMLHGIRCADQSVYYQPYLQRRIRLRECGREISRPWTCRVVLGWWI